MALSFSAVSVWAAPQANSDDATRRATPVATYDGGAVTVGEIEDTIADSSPLIQAGALEPEALRGFLDRNLRFELELKEAERRGYRDDARVKQAMKDNVVQVMISHEINSKIRAEPPPSDVLKAYFEKNISVFSLHERRRATLIVLPTAEDARTLVPTVQASDIDKLRILVRTRGREVPSKAKDGDLGSFDADGKPETGESQVDPALVKAAFALRNIGDVSDVIRLSTGYGLIKLTEIRAGHTPTFEEVRIRVLRRYDDERYDREVQAIADAARERVKPVVHYELLDQVKLD